MVHRLPFRGLVPSGLSPSTKLRSDLIQPGPVNPRVFLAAVGDATDPVTWSGTPYYFLETARPMGLVHQGLPLSVEGWPWRLRRAMWNAQRVALGDRVGGYQYSTAFLQRLWAPVHARLRHHVVINCFQLYAPSVVSDRTIERWFFIDQTLLQLFDHYNLRPTVGRRIAADALQREREGYLSAAGVVAHSEWAAESVRRDYGVRADRVFVVTQGANFGIDAYRRWERVAAPKDSFPADGPLRLVFVGKEWRRKGLDRLLAGLTAARRRGFNGTLRVIGCERKQLPVELRDTERVDWVGFIDKRAELSRFFTLISECDIGCLLSRAEAGGCALREYHALGLIVLGPDAGGAREQLIPGASIAVAPTASIEAIASTLLHLQNDSSRFHTLRTTAWKRRHDALWSETVRQMAAFWPYPFLPLTEVV